MSLTKLYFNFSINNVVRLNDKNIDHTNGEIKGKFRNAMRMTNERTDVNDDVFFDEADYTLMTKFEETDKIIEISYFDDDGVKKTFFI